MTQPCFSADEKTPLLKDIFGEYVFQQWRLLFASLVMSGTMIPTVDFSMVVGMKSTGDDLAGMDRIRYRLRNDLYCVEWGVKLYSLTHRIRFTTSSTITSDNSCNRHEA